MMSLVSGGDRVYRPQAYWRIHNPEDRLFVPTEYMPLFTEYGWKKRRASPRCSAHHGQIEVFEQRMSYRWADARPQAPAIQDRCSAGSRCRSVASRGRTK
jgi:hypothetical protein